MKHVTRITTKSKLHGQKPNQLAGPNQLCTALFARVSALDETFGLLLEREREADVLLRAALKRQ
jgi:hypothetical protein